jgi:hypothetical protein
MKLRMGRVLACLLLAQASFVIGAFALGSAQAADNSAPSPPPAADLLFETPQMGNTKVGDKLDYSYSQKSADPAQYGESFDDKIKLMVDEAGKAPNERTVRVEMFSGEHKKPAGPFVEMTGNPVMMLMLENNVQQLSEMFKANPRYFKNAIRRALRDAPSVPDQIDGQKQAWRVEVTPFKDDPDKGRLRGLDALTYVFRVSPDLPGVIYEIDISARDPAGAVLLQEKLRYDGQKS